MLMTGNINSNKNRKKVRFPAMREFFEDSPFLAMSCLLMIILGIILVLGITIQMYSGYHQDNIKNDATQRLQSLKTIDKMMVGTMDLSAKMVYLKQMAQMHNTQVLNEDGQVSLLMKTSPEECQAFFNQLPDYIGYHGYALTINNVNQGFNPGEPVAQDMKKVMCAQSSNTIVRHYFIINGTIVDFSDLSQYKAANDDNRPTPVPDNSNAGNVTNQVNASSDNVDNNGSGATSQSIVIDNGNVHIVINNSTGYVQQDDSDNDSDDSDDNSAQSQPPCDPRNNQ
jgi:hypothetical protein